MTVAACVFAGALLLVLWLRDREQRRYLSTLERILAAGETERQELLARAGAERSGLLDRIQHPERAVVEPGPQVEREPPRDAGEFAQVGQLVPEFVSVGDAGNGSYGGSD